MKACGAYVVTLAILLHAGRAESGSFTLLGDLGGPSPGVNPYTCAAALAHYSIPYGISADGSTVVGMSKSDGPEAFRWTEATGMVGLGDLPGGGQYNNSLIPYYFNQSGELTDDPVPIDPCSFAFAVSADGNTIAGRAVSDRGYEAFRWTPSTGMVGLGHIGNMTPAIWDVGSYFPIYQPPIALDPYLYSHATSISADGKVVVGYSTFPTDLVQLLEGYQGLLIYHGTQIWQAFRWTEESGMVSLGSLNPDWPNSYASAISADGTTIVGFTNTATGLHAFRWTEAEGMIDLGALSSDPNATSFADVVSPDGSVIFGTSQVFGYSTAEGFRWTAADGMQRIPTLFQLPAGARIYGISADGETTIGAYPSGYQQSVLFVRKVWPAFGVTYPFPLSLQSVLTYPVPYGCGLALQGWTIQSVTALSADGKSITGTAVNSEGVTEGFLANIDGCGMTPPPPNTPPVANAGPDQSVPEGTLVTLDGSASYDPDGDTIVARYWYWAGGPFVFLDQSDPLHPTFVAPAVQPGGATVTFCHYVYDGRAWSAADCVDVVITNVNHAPHAAGSDQTVQEGSSVCLNGSQSYDDDGDALAFHWEQTQGAAVTLSDPTSAQPCFIAPLVSQGGAVLTFALTVTDPGGASGTAPSTLTVENVNHPPTADAGAAQTAAGAATVTLDGRGSSDPDGDTLTFSWTQESGPAVVLSDATASTPSFTAPSPGAAGAELRFTLVVSDGLATSAPAQVTVTVMAPSNPPRCDTARPSVPNLWPPNHKLVPVDVLGVADADPEQITVAVTSVWQDEPVNGLGDGDTTPDAVLASGDRLLLRAERSGLGDGRVYHVRFRASRDGASCTGEVKVCVPHDQRGGSAATCVDQGSLFNSLEP